MSSRRVGAMKSGPVGRGERVLEQRMAVALLAGHQDVLEIGARLDEVLETRIELFRYDEEPRPAVLQHEAVVGLGHQRVDGDRDHAGLDGAEKRGRPVDGVGQADEDALLARDAEAAQHLAELRDPLGELRRRSRCRADRYRRPCRRARRRDCGRARPRRNCSGAGWRPVQRRRDRRAPPEFGRPCSSPRFLMARRCNFVR